jgi:hypothetical protein
LLPLLQPKQIPTTSQQELVEEEIEVDPEERRKPV